MALGASAGGLQALEQFFGHLPGSSGLAFVVLQHLDPTRPGLLPELLQRATAMKVEEATDQTRVEQGHVYVIPPSKDLSILRGVLHLLEPSAPRGLRLPIDLFFRALAADQGSTSVGIVLSGMGTDGTLGIRAIKEQGGVVLVQDPATAAFDGMPRSAVETGLADIVAPVEALPERLLGFLRSRPASQPGNGLAGTAGLGTLQKIAIVLRARTGHDFSRYKKSTQQRRVERRMALHQISSPAGYLRFLQENPQEQELLFNELLIGVTGFFRDPPAWDVLRDKVLPELLERHPGGGQLRAWSVGCSTGEEACSLAMVFKEVLERVRPRNSYSLQVFATDLHRGAIDQARQGVYPANVAADVSPDRLRRFFVKEEDGRFRLSKEIREMLILAAQDVIRDPPFTRLDLVVCRNLLIYLEPEMQRRLLPLLHHSLNPGGVLFLGSSETIGGLTDLFSPLDAKHRIYRRRSSAARLDPSSFPSSFRAPREPPPGVSLAPRPAESLSALAEQALHRLFGRPAVLVNEAGDVLYFSGRTGDYLEPPAGKAHWNIFAMARDGLRQDLSAAIRSATRRNRQVIVAGLRVRGQGPGKKIDLTVQPLDEPEALRGLLLVVFSEAAGLPEARGGREVGHARHAGASRARLAELEEELRQTADELQTSREEMRASQEELKSSNEELQSINEELQSTNEELTTSKEELQSMNEELQTVNGELQAKLDELSRTSNDMKNLLNATEIATLFLDRDLKVRRFTSQATRLVKLIPGDVGRPVTDLSSDLLHPDLSSDVEEVLRTLVFRERSVCTADGRWFTVRVLPYRTLENVIDGVVITMVDVTQAKSLEAELRQGRDRLGALLGRLAPDVAILDDRGRVVPAEVALERVEAASPEDLSAWRIAARAEARGEPP
ncbi:MAG TPA: chemotaxis protein CheB [Anaeromyxobacter sp.]|nr:chemotaxis protein CheB [Anaeromyxobacter sp.]